jgi:hypothetical protein
VCGTTNEVNTWVENNATCSRKHGRVYLVESRENRGYSAGNNHGIRLAQTLQADAVLVANPDMRIDDSNYLKELCNQLFADSGCHIAASRIIDLDGINQNPLREPSFMEELIWPRSLLMRFCSPTSYILDSLEDKVLEVPKVLGCCLLIRMEFLKSTNYLDENVFLYCEEPILSAKVRAINGKILFVPTVTAVHAHDRGKKGDTSKRMAQYINSRKYYLTQYSGYKFWQLNLLSFSYALLKIYNQIKGILK